MRPRLLSLLLAAGALASCSPVYVLKSAAGHARLLASRRAVADAAADERLPAERREKLRLVLDVRRFAFETMKLAPTSDYERYAEVKGPVTWVVTAAPKLELKAHQWWFPFVGRVPYKGFFKKKDALAERSAMQRKGLDASVRPVGAYNTPLWISDPLPSSALELPDGDLAALIIHELSHGSFGFKDRMDFNESAAAFIGERGARDFLVSRGTASAAEYAGSLRETAEFASAVEAFCKELETLYASPRPDAEKLAARETVFARAKARLGELGWKLDSVDNAVLMSYRIYRRDASAFERLYERLGGDWPRFFAELRSLDRKDPAADLARRAR